MMGCKGKGKGKRLLMTALLAVAATGCAGSLERARVQSAGATAGEIDSDREYCRKLATRVDRQKTWSIVLGSGAAAVSAGTIPAQSDDAELTLAISGVAMGLGAAGLAYSSGASAARWARDCAQ